MFKSVILKKITLIILAVSLGSILVSGFAINLALNRQFQTYLTRSQVSRQEAIVKILADFYQENGGWYGLTNGQPGFGPGRLMGGLYLVTDINNQPVIASPRLMMRHRQNQDSLTARPVMVGDTKVGTAYFGPDMLQNMLTRQDMFFRKTINLSIVLAIVITGLLSLVVAVVFAKRFSQPITEMNRIAKDMTAGNLDSRIKDLPSDEIGELGTSLNSLAEKLQQVNELRKKMTVDVAHDLRTPLTTVKSHLEGIIDQVIPASSENLESLLEEINRLTVLVNDLQAVATADTTIQQFNIEPLELRAFLEDIHRNMLPLFREKEISFNLSQFQPVILKLDRNALAKIMQNLFSNAYKFTPNGKQVLVDVIRKEETVEITVTDEGVGISSKDLPYIFERFYRTDQSRNRDSGGFGLGLTIVKELVAALGGTISVSSRLGEGSTFKVIFPLDKDQVE